MKTIPSSIIRTVFCLLFTFFTATFVSAQDNVPAANPKDMMRSYLLGEIAKERENWQRRYDTLKTVEDVQKYQDERITFFKTQLGLTKGSWEKTPLNPRVTKTFQKGTPGKDAYRVEMVLFESQPNFFVSGAMYLPDETRFKGPYPTLLVVCGHSSDGKEYTPYQQVTALAATHGLAALIIDPIDQGERVQHFNAEGKPTHIGVAAHNLLGPGSILLGRNTATFEVWDMIRALDYLESREDVDATKMGVMGNSGGGTQTSYIMTLDERVKVAIPCCYICGLYDQLTTSPGPQDAEQNIFGQLGFGMDHVDYLIMRAPQPTLIECVTRDFFPIDDTWKAYRNAKRIYDRFGYAEKIALIENDNTHSWNKNLREGAVRWALRWLADRDELITEAEDMPVCAPGELWAAPEGRVMNLEGARTAFDLNRDYNTTLQQSRRSVWRTKTPLQQRTLVRERIGVRPMAQIPEPEVVTLTVGMDLAKSGLSEKWNDIATVTKIVFKFEDEKVVLPALLLEPKIATEKSGVVIYLNDAGKTADIAKLEEFVNAGKTVLAVDLRGLGETQAVGPTYFHHDQYGTDGTDFYLAYLLGKSYVGMRTEDLLMFGRFSMKGEDAAQVSIYADGEVVSVVAAHAAFIRPAIFSGVEYKTVPKSWSRVVLEGTAPYPITNIVHGALEDYDVTNLLPPELQPQDRRGRRNR